MNPLRKLAELARKQAAKLDKMEEETSRLSYDLQLQAEESERNGSVPPQEPGSSRRRGPGGRRNRDEEVLGKLAERGVEIRAMFVQRHADGSATVRIGDCSALRLPPMLADLLELLCADWGTSHDDLVGYKPVKQLALLLGKKANTHMEPHALSQNVRRLREAMRDNGYNPYLVQTSRQQGIRFAVKRSPAK